MHRHSYRCTVVTVLLQELLEKVLRLLSDGFESCHGNELILGEGGEDQIENDVFGPSDSFAHLFLQFLQFLVLFVITARNVGVVRLVDQLRLPGGLLRDFELFAFHRHVFIAFHRSNFGTLNHFAHQGDLLTGRNVRIAQRPRVDRAENAVGDVAQTERRE